eukprot:114699_1
MFRNRQQSSCGLIFDTFYQLLCGVFTGCSNISKSLSSKFQTYSMFKKVLIILIIGFVSTTIMHSIFIDDTFMKGYKPVIEDIPLESNPLDGENYIQDYVVEEHPPDSAAPMLITYYVGAVMCSPCLWLYCILLAILKIFIEVGKLCCPCCGIVQKCGSKCKNYVDDCFINDNRNYAVPTELTSNWEEYRRMFANIDWRIPIDTYEVINTDRHYYPILNAIYHETDNTPSRIRTRHQFIEALQNQNVYKAGNKLFVDDNCANHGD